MLNGLVSWVLRKRITQIREWMEHPDTWQEKVLIQQISKAKDTEWGKKFDYKSIKSIDDFKLRVPVSEYDSFLPYINRIMKGEQNILWNEQIKWFSKSSGTTAEKSKFIPVSENSIENCHYRGVIDMMAAYCIENENTNIFSGKGLIVGGSHQINSFNENSKYGDLSAILMQNMSMWAQWYRTPDLSIALMDDWEKKIEALVQSTVHENVTNISGVPTWTIVLIKRLFELSGKNNLKDVWPELELYMHGGVSFSPYREQFKNLIRFSEMNYYQSYNASEGYFAFQFGKHDDDMLLHMNTGIFYEFMPMSEYGKENPRTLQLHEVKPKENYALIISNSSGMWRYLIGDTIQFTSVAPYKIIVSGRVKHYINAFGEEVMVDNADRAIGVATQQTNSVVRDYTVAPVYLSIQSKGCHQWLIEFENPPADLALFTKILDDTLRAVNSDYDAKRNGDIAVLQPQIKILPDGTFHRWLKQKGKLGGQHKVPRLSNNREFVEEILEMIS